VKTNDTILEWIKRIWLWILTPILVGLVYFVSKNRGMEGGFAIIWTTLIFVPMSWPLGGISAAFLMFWPAWWPFREYVVWMIVLIPAFGYLQWFVLIPKLFARWDEVKIKRFWKYWVASFLVGVLLFGGGFLLINLIPYRFYP